ncbi:MAG: hypothetical protein JO034_30735 [Singulisphaera sp.]|nr:hypothetical protein [Singulisphaera sp.]
MSTTDDLRGRAARLRGQLSPIPAGSHPPEDTGRRLATCPRGKEEELRISWCEYEGNPYLNLRIWKRDQHGRGWWPDKRGIAIRVRELPDLAEALAAALDLMAEHQDGRPALPPATPHPRRDRAIPALPLPRSAGGGEDFDEFA